MWSPWSTNLTDGSTCQQDHVHAKSMHEHRLWKCTLIAEVKPPFSAFLCSSMLTDNIMIYVIPLGQQIYQMGQLVSRIRTMQMMQNGILGSWEADLPTMTWSPIEWLRGIRSYRGKCHSDSWKINHWWHYHDTLQTWFSRCVTSRRPSLPSVVMMPLVVHFSAVWMTLMTFFL